MQTKPRLALLVNMITPYRVPVYQCIGEAFEMAIFHGGQESNRSAWQTPEANLSNVKVKRSWGFQLLFKKKDKQNKTFDPKYFHVNPGFLWDLIQYRPDVVITTEMGIRTALALVYGIVFRKPVWIWSGVTCHSEQSIGVARKIVRSLVVKRSSRWISYGQAATEYLQSLGVSSTQIVQIQNCVNEKLYQNVAKPLLQFSPKPTLLYVGQLIQRKGVDRLLEAVLHCQRQGYVFSVAIVGDGDEASALQAYVTEHQLENVHFLGARPPNELPGIYRSADYLVFPTLEDIWGLVVNEALWAGLPVLASIYAGCAQEILPKENIFDPLSLEDTINAIERALNKQVMPAVTAPMWTYNQVAETIIHDIEQTLRSSSTLSHPSRC
jgi:glycosyltransferase involved in cell wall biosynthesis